MEARTTHAKKKYSLNCLLIAEHSDFARDTKIKVEEQGLEVKTIASSIEEIRKALDLYSIDIILSDECVTDINCIHKHYNEIDNLPPLILISELDAIGDQIISQENYPFVFLKKPFNDTVLRSAVGDALRERINDTKRNGDIKRVRETLYLRSSGKLISLCTKDILYIKAEGNYCTIHIKSKRYVIRSSIRNVLRAISHPNFIQIHRGYIANVNLSKELVISKGQLLVGNERLPIGRKYKSDLMSSIKILNSN